MSKKVRQRLLLIAVLILLIAVFAIVINIITRQKGEVRVGVILTGNTEDPGWNSAHYLGVSEACDELDVTLLIKENIAEGTGQCATAVDELVKDGATMVILSSYNYPAELESTFEKYPDVSFYGISANNAQENVTSYFGRMYQARYLSGIIAGYQTSTDVIGYVAAMPNNEVNRGINAFALGVKSVNPDARIVISWTNSWEDREAEISAATALIDEMQADVITCHQNQSYVVQTADAKGVYSIGYNASDESLSDKHLTSAVWDWKTLYKEILREYITNRSNTEKRHWFGLETGAVKLTGYSSLVSEDARTSVENAKAEILSGNDVFSGIIYDTDGVLRCGDYETISDETLLNNMDWFVEGVEFYE